MFEWFKENRVLSLLNGNFEKDLELSNLQKKGKSAEDISEWNALVSEIIQALGSKQLRPTMRTHFYRNCIVHNSFHLHQPVYDYHNDSPNLRSLYTIVVSTKNTRQRN